MLAIVDTSSDSSAEQMQRARLYLEEHAVGARLLAPFPHRGLGTTSVFGIASGDSPHIASPSCILKGHTKVVTRTAVTVVLTVICAHLHLNNSASVTAVARATQAVQHPYQ